MLENILSTDMPSRVSLVEQGLHGLTSPDIREGDTQDDSKMQRSIPLGVALTGYRLFTTCWILGLGIPKAIYSSRGQSLVSPTLDWVGGIMLSLVSFWLGVVETSRPELCPRFFEVDLAPWILKFLRRHDVHLWFGSVLPLLLAAQVMSAAKYATTTKMTQFYGDGTLVIHPDLKGEDRSFPGQYYMRDPVHVSNVLFYKDSRSRLALGVSVAVFLFCLHGLRVLRPKSVIKGKWLYCPLISVCIMWAHMLFLGINGLRFRPYGFILPDELSADPDGRGILSLHSVAADFVLTMNIRLYLWMMPWASPLFSEQSGNSPLLQHFARYCNLILYACPAICEVIWEPSGVFGTLYSLLLLCYALVRISTELFSIIPSSWVTWVTSEWKAASDSVRCSGTEAGEYVLGVHHRVRSAGREAWGLVSDIYDRIRGTLVFVQYIRSLA